MNEVFVIEKMVVLGIWELFSTVAYKDESQALDVCIDLMRKMQQTDDDFVARVTKLEISDR